MLDKFERIGKTGAISNQETSTNIMADRPFLVELKGAEDIKKAFEKFKRYTKSG